MSNKAFYNWDVFHKYVQKIQHEITTKPDVIVSIGKGGSIPGVILAEALGINNLNLGLKSYDKQDRGKIFEYQPISNYDVLRDANILLVDDIADSGATFEYSLKKFKQNFCERVETASVFYKPCSTFKPDYVGVEVTSDTWIVQPWEIND